MTRRIRITRPIFHSAIILASFYLAYIIRLKTDLIPFVQLGIPPIPFTETVLYAGIGVAIFIFISIIKQFYTLIKSVQNYMTIFTKVRIYWIITITFIAYFGQGFIFVGGISRFIIITGGILTGCFILIFDILRNFLEKQSIRNNKRKILIICDDREQAEKIVHKLNYADQQADVITPHQRTKEMNDTYHTTLAVGTVSSILLQNIMDTIRLSNTRFLHIAEGYFLEDVVYSTQTLGSLVALEYKHSKLDGRSVIFKRIFDIVFSLFVLIGTAPITLLTAIAIKLTSRGPILYIQKRIGIHGKHIVFIKFRTMYTHLSTGDKFGGNDAEKLYNDLIQTANTRTGAIPKIANDPRITPLGRFLRMSSIDELPQFILTLRGTMSVVGPRPHLPKEVEKYDIRHTRLLSIKPGITGYAQIFGRHKLNFDEEAKLDLYYIQNRSVRLDIYVIIMTIKVLFQGK